MIRNNYSTTVRSRIPAYRTVWAMLIQMHGAMCVYCHRQVATQIDHILPMSYASNHRISNLVSCCAWCNMLAGNLIFDSFDEKYDYIQKSRSKKRTKRNALHTCTACLFPFYSALHNHAFLCPRCYAFEYQKSMKNSRAWLEWLQVLQAAEICYHAYFDLSDKIEQLRPISVPRSDKIELLVDFTSQRQNFLSDEILERILIDA